MIKINNFKEWHKATEEEAIRWAQYLYYQGLDPRDLDKMITGIKITQEQLNEAPEYGRK